MRSYHKLVIALLLLSVIPTLAISGISFYKARDSLKAAILSNLNNVANKGVEEIESFIDERKSDLMMLARRDAYIAALPILEQFVNDRSNPAYIEARKILDDSLAVFLGACKCVDIKLLNKQGRVIYVSDPRREPEINEFISGKDELLQKAKSGIYVGDERKTDDKEHPSVFIMAGPVYGRANDVLGLVCLELDMNEMFYRLHGDTRLGRSGEIIWARKTANNKILILSPQKNEPAAILKKSLISGEKYALPMQKALSGESGSGGSVDYRGKKVLAAWRPIKSTGWGFVAKIDKAEAFLPIEKLRKLLIAALLLSILLIAAAALLIARAIAGYIIAIHKEIVERKRSEEANTLLKQRIEFILGATNTGLDIIDSGFNIVYIDPAWARVYGDYNGRKCYEYFMDRSEPCPNCGVRKALETKEAVVSEDVLAKEGNRPIQVTTIPFQNENGEWLVAEVNADITERKKAEEHSMKAYEQLIMKEYELIQSEKLAALGSFSSGIVHEVNNPLGIILGGAEFVAAKLAKGDEDVKAVVAAIREAALRASAILSVVLQYARPSTLDTEPVLLNGLVSEILALFKLKPSMAVVVATEFSQEDIRVCVNKNQIQQAVFNIVKNAIEAIPGDGKVIIRTSAGEGMGIIHIIDNGSGMTKETLSRIFDSFFTTKVSGKGTGLGLSVTRKIIEAHKGKVSIESAEGKGTVVRIVLPLAG